MQQWDWEAHTHDSDISTLTYRLFPNTDGVFGGGCGGLVARGLWGGAESLAVILGFLFHAFASIGPCSESFISLSV